MPVLANPSQSALFTLSNEDWTAINKRVGSALLAKPIAAYVQQYINSYPDLVIVSDLWVSSTFDALITESKAITTYAHDADLSFSALLVKVEPYIGGTAPVPPALQQETIDCLAALSAQTTPLSTAVAATTKTVLQFVNVNAQVDASIIANQAQLGSFWAPLGDVIAQTSKAAGKLAGAWSAIADDLKITLASPITVNNAFLQSLNLEASIAMWRTLNAEANSFSVISPAQKVYWSNPF